jgi:surface protein
LSDKDLEGGTCYGLPRIYSELGEGNPDILLDNNAVYDFNYSRIEVLKKDGSIVNHAMVRCSDIEKVILWYPQNTKAVVFRDVYTDSGTAVKEVKYCNTREFISTNYMFSYCKGMETVNAKRFNTKNITNMSHMFYDCSKLTSLDLSNFNTSKVTDMSWMFCYCSKLTSLDVSNWDTSNVTGMQYMFNECYSLTELDLSSFDTSNLIGMHNMFYKCKSLTKLNLSNFDTSNISLIDDTVFYNCHNLTEVRLDNCNKNTIKKIISVLPSENNGVIYCKESQAQGLIAPGNWSFSFVLDTPEDPEVPETPDTPEEPEEDRPLYVSGDFANNTKITTANVMVNSTHIALNNMFAGCTNLISVNTKGWDTSNVMNMLNMFNGCRSLVTLDLSNFNTNKVTNMNWMFYNCSSLETLDMRNFDTSNTTANMRDMFYNCSSLHTLRFDNCSTDTINSIITQSSFPANNAGTIYCSRTAAAELTAPGNWNFSYID